MKWNLSNTRNQLNHAGASTCTEKLTQQPVMMSHTWVTSYTVTTIWEDQGDNSETAIILQLHQTKDVVKNITNWAQTVNTSRGEGTTDNIPFLKQGFWWVLCTQEGWPSLMGCPHNTRHVRQPAPYPPGLHTTTDTLTSAGHLAPSYSQHNRPLCPVIYN